MPFLYVAKPVRLISKPLWLIPHAVSVQAHWRKFTAKKSDEMEVGASDLLQSWPAYKIIDLVTLKN